MYGDYNNDGVGEVILFNDGVGRNSFKLITFVGTDGASINIDSRKEMRATLNAQLNWVTPMPICLSSRWTNDDHASIREGNVDLKRLFPDDGERGLALCYWLGFGKGRWRSYPGYEAIPTMLLLFVDTKALAMALSGADVTDSHLAGAARYFSMTLSHDRPDDLRYIDQKLKKRLVDSVVASGIDENMEIVKSVLE
jgi:hypothetical protein